MVDLVIFGLPAVHNSEAVLASRDFCILSIVKILKLFLSWENMRKRSSKLIFIFIIRRANVGIKALTTHDDDDNDDVNLFLYVCVSQGF